MNRTLATQYRRLLWGLCHKPVVCDADRLAVVYHWILQDRVEEACKLFATLAPPAGSALRPDASSTTEASTTGAWCVCSVVLATVIEACHVCGGGVSVACSVFRLVLLCCAATYCTSPFWCS